MALGALPIKERYSQILEEGEIYVQKQSLEQIDKYTKKHKHHRTWLKIVTALALGVVFCTAYALILPAITMQGTTYCGIEEHTHTPECYENKLICGFDNTEEQSSEPETAPHFHTESCYEKNLICAEPEHIHSLICYSNPEADIEDSYTWANSVAGAKLNGVWSDDIAKIALTQNGYAESTKNYLVDENGAMKGISRYGQWYGDCYADWNSMFASFCISYAKVPTSWGDAAYTKDGIPVWMPIESDVTGWIAQLNTAQTPYYHSVNDYYDYYLINPRNGVCLSKHGESDECQLYHIKKGDLLFLDMDAVNGADKVAVIVTIGYDYNGNITVFNVIEGDSDNAAMYRSYSADNRCILGVAEIPANPALYVEEETVEIPDESVQDETPEVTETETDVNSKAVHFGDEQTDVFNVTPEQTDEGTSFSFEQDSFSTVGTLTGTLASANVPTLLAATDANADRCSITGIAYKTSPKLYSIESSSGKVTAVSGAVYTIRNSSGNIVKTVTTGANVAVDVAGLSAGTYTIEQTSVPNGYIVVPQTKTIEIDSDGYGYIGVFYLYRQNDFGSDKTAQVIDYENRLYQVDLSAKAGQYSYEVEPINIDMLVDQSNSMLFPAELYSTGMTVTLSSDSNDANRFGNLEKNKTYYILTDNDSGDRATSTVYALYYVNPGWNSPGFGTTGWHSGGWVYQDASFYSKAYRHWILGDEENVIEAGGYVNFVTPGVDYNTGANAGTNGGPFGRTLGGLVKSNTQYTINTGSEYNRLHELRQAVANLACLAGSFNENSTLTLETFASDVFSCQTFTLNDSGIDALVEAVNCISTQGGTRQDLALRHIYGDYQGTGVDMRNHLTSGNDYVILATDGAPNKGSISDVVNAANVVKNNYMSGNDKLITVGLSQGWVGGDMLEKSASSPSSTYYRKVEKSGALVTYFTDLYLNQMLHGSKSVSSVADIKDTVSDSFYITDANGNALKHGDRIDLNGSLSNSGAGLVQYDSIKNEWYVIWDDQALGSQSSSTVYTYTDGGGTKTTIDPAVIYYIDYNSNKRISGSGPFDSSRDKLMFENGSWVFRWRDLYGDTNRRGEVGNSVTAAQNPSSSGAAWHGKVYIKAKEDFIGGNTIDTNKAATVSLHSDNSSSKTVFTLPTPTVNVRLLPFAGTESEETVFLGDNIVNIRNKLQTLIDKTVFEKIVSGSGSTLNYKSGATEDNGCYDDSFSIPYAIRPLTEAEWSKLLNGESVNIGYTYDEASSHGDVGYFTFRLTKEIAKGGNSTGGDHESKVVGTDVEIYTLSVEYTSYQISHSLNNVTRPSDVHNGTNGPGIEVGTGNALENGLGNESTSVSHHVHVIDGEIIITKVISENLISDEDVTYTFNLYVIDPDTGTAKGDIFRTADVTVKAGETNGMFAIDGLKRNKYLLTEVSSDDYRVDSVEVVDSDTNCEYTTEDVSIIFDIGTNENSPNADKDVIIFISGRPEYMDSLYSDSMRYVYSYPFANPDTLDDPDDIEDKISLGHGIINNIQSVYYADIPVEKVWDDLSGKHSKDEIFVILYGKDGTPVTNADGNAQMLKLSSSNNWNGKFTISAPYKDYNPITDGYYVREVSDRREAAFTDCFSAVDVNGDNTVYYVAVADEGASVAVNNIGYIVHYTSDSSKLIIKNSKAYSLPKTGGIGTTPFTLGGIIILSAALVVYLVNSKVWRRHERRLQGWR